MEVAGEPMTMHAALMRVRDHLLAGGTVHLGTTRLVIVDRTGDRK